MVPIEESFDEPGLWCGESQHTVLAAAETIAFVLQELY